MKYLMFLVLLPYILALENQNSVCIDGTQCPVGKYCCESGCCDLPEDLEDKGYVDGVPVSTAANVSMAGPKVMNAPCAGTQCGVFCVPAIKYGVCCSIPATACPYGTRCCSNAYVSKPWCCLARQKCSSITNKCRNGAVTISSAMISVLLAFMIGMFSKHFL